MELYSECRKRPTQLSATVSDKGAKAIYRGIITFSTNGTGVNGINYVQNGR